ncbi:MBL fold metallo-hydrolase [Methylotuvimicrobium sp.]|uniref:MBL fold metallo-hydrolase n=1 Tax=Methylotuvimicrobium sp. TaxID=2822413 RepID=UPI003D65C000
MGECIVLNFGEGRWFIIDSCLCPITKQPIALNYLQSIGVDVSQQVIGILITHWHSDHIEGASALLKACHNAKLYCSIALLKKEAFQLAALYKKDIFADTDKDIREFREIIEFLRETGDRNRFSAVKNRHTFFDYRNTVPTRLVALSPSDVAVTQSIASLTQLAQKQGKRRTRNVVPTSENLNAVALHFSFGNFSALLGSDLEETGNPQTGWSAIFENNVINELSLSSASLFKVAHHGSETGYHDKIWQELLIKSPLSMTTPYTRSSLPTADNINKLQKLSSHFLITRDPQANKRIKRENMVERELRSIAKDRKTINEKMGHIQIRITIDGNLNISGNENAVKFTTTAI